MAVRKRVNNMENKEVQKEQAPDTGTANSHPSCEPRQVGVTQTDTQPNETNTD